MSSLFSILFPKLSRYHFKENRENVLEELKARELELKNSWLTKSDGYQLICNHPTDLSSKDLNSLWTKNLFKNIGIFFCTGGLYFFFYVWKKRKEYSYLSTLRQLSEIDERKREIQNAKNYFQKIEDSEKSFRESKERELDNWSERIISYSLSTIPYSQYEIERNRKKDPYIKFLHIYAFVISLVLTCGTIIFYILYRKYKDPRYKFLESSITKHVIEKTKFESILQELVQKKYGFDVLDNLSYCYSKTLGDIATESHIRTKFYSYSVLKVLFFLFMTAISAGIFPLYCYWLSTRDKLNSKKDFYKWWLNRRKKEREIVTPLKLFKKKWWGKGCLYFKKVWLDWYFSTFVAQLTNRAITSNFFKPKTKLKNLNWTLMWMFTSPLSKWIVNLVLLIATYTFLLLWSLSASFAIVSPFFFLLVFFGSAFLLLLGYHISLII
ncbi:hypothetical protein [Mycoplasma suis]|uniref:Putative membrane protein n=1 Tax=Mycoplasma suis (strain Illinois) TaxID=768700 RepID=F0QR79_MYCSL|nr:hypothetical protein [Mycoplasma suis]ADX97999.1 putative membrane protein [Mycoplasma suis str. Illinois]